MFEINLRASPSVADHRKEKQPNRTEQNKWQMEMITRLKKPIVMDFLEKKKRAE